MISLILDLQKSPKETPKVEVQVVRGFVSDTRPRSQKKVADTGLASEDARFVRSSSKQMTHGAFVAVTASDQNPEMPNTRRC